MTQPIAQRSAASPAPAGPAPSALRNAVPSASRIAARRRAWLEEARASLSLSGPLILTNAIEMAMLCTNTAMIGRLGPDLLAASALATNLYVVFLLFAIGIVTAVAPMLANEIGRDRDAVDELRRTVQAGLWAALGIAVPIWLVLLAARPILVGMGQAPTLAAEAARYLHVFMWGLLPFLAYLVLRSLLAALERPGWAVVVGCLAVAVNAAANWCLIFGHLGLPALGLDGSGVATLIANLFLFVGLGTVVLLDPSFRRYRVFARLWALEPRRLRELWRLGLPIGVALAFEAGNFSAAGLVMGLIGADALAAHTVALQIASLAFMIPLGLGQAVTVRVGRAHGAEDRPAVARAGWVAFALGMGCMAITATTMLVFTRPLAGLFLDIADPANAGVLNLAVVFTIVAALFQFADGAQVLASGMLRGLKDTRTPMIYAGLGYWAVGLPVGMALAFLAGLKGLGIWIGLAVGLFTVAALLLHRWVRRDRFLVALAAR